MQLFVGTFLKGRHFSVKTQHGSAKQYLEESEEVEQARETDWEGQRFK